MKPILSGASGYIGTNLVAHFLSSGIDPGVILRKSSPLKILEGRETYLIDLQSTHDVKTTSKYDTFIHLAAANDIVSKDPLAALLNTAFLTRNALDFCVKNSIKKFVYFSTYQVYGYCDGSMNEKSQLLPVNDYAITHLFAEDYLKMYQRVHGIEFIILRPTNIYGAPYSADIQRWTLVPNCFCKEAFENQTITLLSSGKQTRDFIDLNDLSIGTIEMINRFDEFKNQTIDFASGNHFSILEIAELVKKEYELLFKRECTLLVKSDQPAAVNQFSIERSSVKRLKKTAWNPKSLSQEIEKIFSILAKSVV